MRAIFGLGLLVLLAGIFWWTNNSGEKGISTIKQGERTGAIAAGVSSERLKNANATPSDWLSYGRTYDEQRHSPLTQINQETVTDLGVAWTYELRTDRGVEATPIVVDGTMFVTSAWSVVHALDAKTGAERWVYDPAVPRAWGANACCDVVNRGVAVFEGRVFVGTIDGRLEALDATTGKRVWSTLTIDKQYPYTITGAPRVVNGLVLIGNGGAELGVRGYLSAYDAITGDLVWRFYTTPNPAKQPDGAASDAIFAEMANATWGDEGEWKRYGGGGTVWDSIIYDQVNDLVIFGVGNGSPWNRRLRDPSGGDNVFLSSIVAVKADTGAYVWHFQTTPGDTWDYTATQSLILADLLLEGSDKAKRVVMQAPKNGFFYVIDAATGDFLSGVPFVLLNWAISLTPAGRPIERDGADYATTAHLQTPGPLGAHNWQPMAFSPDTGLAYIPAQEIPQVYMNDIRFYEKAVKWNTGADFSAGAPIDILPAMRKAIKSSLKGRLLAWDPVKQRARWAVEHKNPWNGGVLSTAGGLVFQGTLEGDFTAYSAATGDKLWSMDVKSGVASGASTYALDGEQYVAVTTGWGSAYTIMNGFAFDKKVQPLLGKVVVFKLGGTATIPQADYAAIDQTPKGDDFGTADQLAAGNVHYQRNCLVCHGAFAISAGVLPDLRWSAITGDEALFQDVVHAGAFSENGMIAFDDVLTKADITAIRAYILRQAHAVKVDSADPGH